MYKCMVFVSCNWLDSIPSIEVKLGRFHSPVRMLHSSDRKSKKRKTDILNRLFDSNKP